MEVLRYLQGNPCTNPKKAVSKRGGDGGYIGESPPAVICS
jgi:hypothetical protein